MLEITFLGTGDAYAARYRTNVSLLVREGQTVFQLECGPTTIQQLDRVGMTPDQITHLFISHRHGDHLLGLPMFLLLRYMGGAPGDLTIWGNADTIQAGQALLKLVYPELDERLTTVTWEILPDEERSVRRPSPDLQLTTVPTSHSAQSPVLALRLDFLNTGRSLVYTGDTTYNETIVELARDCDLLVHEANFSELLHPGVNASSYGHSTARQAGQAAAAANCRILALVHISGDSTGREDQVRAEAAQAFDGHIIIPQDSVTLYL